MKHFDEDGYIEWVIPFLDEKQTSKEVDLIVKGLQLPINSKILDLGCGNGRLSVLLSKCGFNVHGLDSSEKLIAMAKENASEQNVKIDFCKGDMRKLPFKDNEFDGIFNFYSSFGFYDNEENITVLKEIRRVLKLQGKFLLETINRDTLSSSIQKNLKYDIIRRYMIEDIWNFNSITNKLTVKREVFNKNTLLGNAVLEIRLYSLSELMDMFSKASLSFIASHSNPFSHLYYSTDIKRLIIVGQKSASNYNILNSMIIADINNLDVQRISLESKLILELNK